VNCGTRDIHFDDAHPGVAPPPLRCRTCGASSDSILKALLALPSPKNIDAAHDEASQNAIEPIPSGQRKSLRLQWPACLPFTTQLNDEEKGDIAHEEEGTKQDTGVEPSVIYSTSLGPDQIRLACLSPLCEIESPLHLDLEVYDRANCPEYETVSYTWGGEDGNASA